jgi:hypothetical protein
MGRTGRRVRGFASVGMAAAGGRRRECVMASRGAC